MNMNPEEQYVIREGYIDGLYAVITANAALKEYPHTSDYPWRLEIVVDIKDRNKDSLPTNEEAQVLYAFEDNIEELLSGVCRFHFIGRKSWNGERTLLYYLDEPQQAHEALQSLIEETERRKKLQPEAIREFAYDLREDEDWVSAREYFE